VRSISSIAYVFLKSFLMGKDSSFLKSFLDGQIFANFMDERLLKWDQTVSTTTSAVFSPKSPQRSQKVHNYGLPSHFIYLLHFDRILLVCLSLVSITFLISFLSGSNLTSFMDTTPNATWSRNLTSSQDE